MILELRRRHIQLVLLVLACCLPSLAKAQCFLYPRFTPQNIIMDFGQVIISPDAQVGEVLAMREFPINGVEYGRCVYSSGLAIGEILQGGASSLSPAIYTTNIPGIGIRLARRRQDSIINDIVYYPHTTATRYHTRLVLSQGFFRVELIKTEAQTGSGPLLSGTYSTYYLRELGPSRPILTSTVLGSGVTVVSSSCEVDMGSRNIAVTFDSVSSSQFSGVGSTLSPREFDIQLNCTGPSLGEDVIALSFDYAPDASGADGVIRVDEGTSAASGIGVQLLDRRSDSPVSSGDLVEVGSLSGTSLRSLSLPLEARYYQVGPSVGGGEVRATATFTIQYR